MLQTFQVFSNVWEAMELNEVLLSNQKKLTFDDKQMPKFQVNMDFFE